MKPVDLLQPAPLWSLRVRTLLLVLVAVVPALVLMAWTAKQQREHAAQQTKETTLRLARLAAADAEGRVEGARQFLSALAQLPSVRRQDALICNALFSRLRPQYPAYANFGAISPDGNIFASAVPLRTRVSAKDRLYFRRAMETGTFSVGEYQVGRITGMESINFAYPVFAYPGAPSAPPSPGVKPSRGRIGSGRIVAVVFAALKLEWMRTSTEWQLPRNTTLTILDDRGVILLRFPNAGEWAGKTLPNRPLVHRILTQREGTAESVGLDGVPRLYAFTPLASNASDNNVFVSIGVPLDEVYGNIDRVFQTTMLSMGGVAIIALIFAWLGGDWFFLRQVKALMRAAQQLSRGDLTARTGLKAGHDELSQLTHAFDEMADSLEHLTGQHELILRSAGEGIFGVNTQGITTFVNPAAARMLGYKPEELIGKPHHDLLHPTRADGSDYPETECPVYAAYTDGTVHRGDDEAIRRKDGTWFPVDYVATPAREHGQVVGAVVTFKDITERKKAEEEVRRAHEEVLQAAAEKKRFFGEAIRAVTNGKLNLVEPDEIPLEGKLVCESPLQSPENDRAARKVLRQVAEEAGMPAEAAQELMLAAGEATTNAVKHAVEGRCAIYITRDRVIVRVTDKGTGIRPEDLPASILERGFSTKVSLGMGYKMMLELVDRVWLATGPEGTIVQLEKWIHPAEKPRTALTAALERV